jgi:tetrahydromethanopterin S-methyltransferase subunit G
MSPAEIELIIARLDRIESKQDRLDEKLEEVVKCQYQKMPRVECDVHRDRLWDTVDSLTRKVWIAVGIAVAVQVFVVPIVLWLIMR